MSTNIARKYAREVSIEVMEHSGYKASIMATGKLPDNGRIHKLPPGRSISLVPIHCLPGCPDDWIRESGSYVVPVTPDIGLWFDWTMNDSHNVAVVPSVKGMNPITGQKVEGCQMEQYRDVCPIHKTPFAHGRYCEQCQYSWAPQNYVSSPNTLWWDGFFQSDGTVRQFFYTEEERKDVASALIGKQNTMPAFGFAFFKYKHERPVSTSRIRGINMYLGGDSDLNGDLKKGVWQEPTKGIGSVVYSSNTGKFGFTPAAASSAVDTDDEPDSIECCSMLDSDEVSRSVSVNFVSDEVKLSNSYSADNIKTISEEDGRKHRPSMYEKTVTKEVSVGAGAAISQALAIDTRPLADYHAEPQALMRIYFCFEEQFKAIVEKGGVKKLEQKKNGFLNGVPVGG